MVSITIYIANIRDFAMYQMVKPSFFFVQYTLCVLKYDYLANSLIMYSIFDYDNHLFKPISGMD